MYRDELEAAQQRIASLEAELARERGENEPSADPASATPPRAHGRAVFMTGIAVVLIVGTASVVSARSAPAERLAPMPAAELAPPRLDLMPSPPGPRLRPSMEDPPRKAHRRDRGIPVIMAAANDDPRPGHCDPTADYESAAALPSDVPLVPLSFCAQCSCGASLPDFTPQASVEGPTACGSSLDQELIRELGFVVTGVRARGTDEAKERSKRVTLELEVPQPLVGFTTHLADPELDMPVRLDSIRIVARDQRARLVDEAFSTHTTARGQFHVDPPEEDRSRFLVVEACKPNQLIHSVDIEFKVAWQEP